MAGGVISAEAQSFVAHDKVSRHCSGGNRRALALPGLAIRGSKELMQTFPAFPPPISYSVGKWRLAFSGSRCSRLLCAGAAVTVRGRTPRTEKDA